MNSIDGIENCMQHQQTRSKLENDIFIYVNSQPHLYNFCFKGKKFTADSKLNFKLQLFVSIVGVFGEGTKHQLLNHASRCCIIYEISSTPTIILPPFHSNRGILSFWYVP